MRIMVVAPGPSWSVSDVHIGVVEGLRANDIHVLDVNFDDRLMFFERARLVRDDGSFAEPMAPELACELATESVVAQVFAADPDAVIVISGFFLAPWFYPLLKARGVPVVLWDTETPYELDRVCSISKHCAATVLCDPTGLDAVRLYCPRVLFVPHGYRPQVHHPPAGTVVPQWDVIFVGTGYPSRQAWFASMDWSGVRLGLAGMWLDVDPRLAPHVITDRGVDNTTTAGMYRQSRLGLSLYRRETQDGIVSHSQGWAMSPRDVEMAACGLPFLRERRGEADGVLGFLPVLDDDPGGIAGQIRWWLAHDDMLVELGQRAAAAVSDRTFSRTVRPAISMIDDILITPGR